MTQETMTRTEILTALGQGKRIQALNRNCWIPTAEPAFRSAVTWRGGDGQLIWLERGLVHNTVPAARAHAMAMIEAKECDE